MLRRSIVPEGQVPRSQVALHCGKAHVQSQWERANFDPQWHQNPWKFLNLNLTSMIKYARFTTLQIFISIRSAGASPKIGEILRFCDFFLVILYFSLARAHVELWRDFHSLWLIRCGFTQRRSFWGVDNIGRHLEVISPKSLQKGSWIGNFKISLPNIKIAIFCKV